MDYPSAPWAQIDCWPFWVRTHQARGGFRTQIDERHLFTCPGQNPPHLQDRSEEVAWRVPGAWMMRSSTWHNDLVVDHVLGGHGEDIGAHGNVKVHLAGHGDLRCGSNKREFSWEIVTIKDQVRPRWTLRHGTKYQVAYLNQLNRPKPRHQICGVCVNIYIYTIYIYIIIYYI